jgi:hypothetical protein
VSLSVFAPSVTVSAIVSATAIVPMKHCEILTGSDGCNEQTAGVAAVTKREGDDEIDFDGSSVDC